MNCEEAVSTFGKCMPKTETADLLGHRTATESPAVKNEVGSDVEIRSRPGPALQCYYVQGGKKLHLDVSCCDMSRPKEVMIPAAASPFVAWCQRCAQDRVHWKGS